MFAISCLRRVLDVIVSSNVSEHLDLSAARFVRESLKNGASKDSEVDYLVFRLADLIKMAFSAATAQIDDLRLQGLYIIQELIHAFKDK